MQAAIAELPAGARLRVLEIGAGTGGTTTYVLPVLQRATASSTPSPICRRSFSSAPPSSSPRIRSSDAALLDIERDPLEQGFEAGGYDIVIAANVLHATADLQKTLAHIRSLHGGREDSSFCSRAWRPSGGST